MASPFKSPVVVGIAGGTGAGKTSAARHVCEKYGSIGVALLDEDSYYLDRSHLAPEARRLVNYDEPAAIDRELLLAHLRQLIAGSIVNKPVYCFATHTRGAATSCIQPAPLIVLEGLFTFCNERIRDLFSIKVYIDADSDLRLIRRLRRDTAERSRSIESVIGQYLETVRPMHLRHIEPTKVYADLVLDGSSGSYSALDELIQRQLVQ